MDMAQKQQTTLTPSRAKNRCPPMLETLIRQVNEIDGDTEIYGHMKSLCKGVHELAQLAALPVGMRDGYATAVVGTDEEWEHFCQGLPGKPWRKWPEMNIQKWQWPQTVVELVIDSDGRILPVDFVLSALRGVEARRLRECRVCQKIFWASRLDRKGGPYGCSSQCNNTLYQRDSRERKKP